MIKVSLSDLILISMALGVSLVCVLWVLAVMGERRRERRNRGNVVRCRICGSVYQNPGAAAISTCPACLTPNEKNRLDAI